MQVFVIMPCKYLRRLHAEYFLFSVLVRVFVPVGLLAVRILGIENTRLRLLMKEFMSRQEAEVPGSASSSFSPSCLLARAVDPCRHVGASPLCDLPSRFYKRLQSLRNAAGATILIDCSSFVLCGRLGNQNHLRGNGTIKYAMSLYCMYSCCLAFVT